VQALRLVREFPATLPHRRRREILTSLGQGAPLDGVPPGDVLPDEGPAAASPFAGLIQSARYYLIFLLLVWVGAMVHAWFAARKFNRKNGIELR
jgi:hypothetical protein